MSQIANNRFPLVMLLGGLSVNLNHLKRQHSPSKNHLSTPLGERASKTLFPRVGNLPIFYAAWKFLTKSV